MPLHVYLIANQTGLNFRADLNEALSAIVSNNSNATEPTTTFAYMWWVDTTAAILKQRNSSNTAWVDILNLTTGASVATAINDLIDATTEGVDNLGLGKNALEDITTAYNDTVVGKDAGKNITTANNNTFVGKDAGRADTTGSLNTFVGVQAGIVNIGGYQNTVAGFNACSNNTEGYENNAFGLQALPNNTIGFRNIAIGNNAGNNITTEEYTITMGYNLQSLGSNYFTFGKNAGSDRVYNQFTANATWTRASDKRIKKDIQTNKDCGLGFINALRTVTYKFKAPNELDPSLSEYDKDNDQPSHDKKMYGFIAQEVKEVLDNHNIKDFAGWHIDEKGKDKMQGISYEMFVMPLVKSVQELSVKNQELSDEIQEQNDTINLIMERIEALENLTK